MAGVAQGFNTTGRIAQVQRLSPGWKSSLFGSWSLAPLIPGTGLTCTQKGGWKKERIPAYQADPRGQGYLSRAGLSTVCPGIGPMACFCVTWWFFKNLF